MDDAPLRRQYEAAVERAGLRIPTDQQQIMFNTYKQVLGWAEIVRAQPRPGSAEPSNIYDLGTVTRLADQL